MYIEWDWEAGAAYISPLSKYIELNECILLNMVKGVQ